jgi:hypothetical protein
MKELSLNQMEMLSGGSSCGAAVGLGVLAASAILISATFAPAIWGNPKTWYAAATMVSGVATMYHENCIK